MNGLLSQWWVRAGIVGGLTWLAYRFIPVPGPGKTAIVALGAVSIAGIVATSPALGPVVRMALSGTLPMPATVNAA